MKPTAITKKFEPFIYKSLPELKKTIKDLKLNIPISRKTELLKDSVKVKEVSIPNRIGINPMEGFDSNSKGAPSELTFRRYKRYAKGGAGLIWFEATALTVNCRSNEHQLMITEQNLDQFKDLVNQTRATCNETLAKLGFDDKCVLILQLNHSGRYTKRQRRRFPIRAYPNPELDAAIHVSETEGQLISDVELKELERIWVKKALLAKEAGFDGVDIKSCHGYLISELLSARTRENSAYGGEKLAKRTRFLLKIIKTLQNKVTASRFFITTRLGVYDGIPYPNGFGIVPQKGEIFPAAVDLTEPLILIKDLYKLGVRVINISAGNPHYTPYITRPYNIPVKRGDLPPEHPLFGVSRLITLTSLIKQQIPKDLVLVGSCYSYLRQYAGYVCAGLIENNLVDVCGFGRMAFANPNFPRQIFQEGAINKKQSCITCSKCTDLMKLGKPTGCALRDPQYQ
ncbi:MAG: oxidoreductase [Candidatus Helarchaeota archaeon]